MPTRTDQEIIDRINSIPASNLYHTRVSLLVIRLPLDMARSYLPSNPLSIKWHPSPRDKDSVRKELSILLPLTWDFANKGDTVHLARMLSMLTDFVWLAGGDLGDLTQFTDDGKENLRNVCTFFDIDPNQWDNTQG